MENILDILACIDECKEDPFEVMAPQFSEELNKISTVILLMLSWDDRRDAFVTELIEKGVQVKVIVATDDRAKNAPDITRPGMQVVTMSQIREGIDEL